MAPELKGMLKQAGGNTTIYLWYPHPYRNLAQTTHSQNDPGPKQLTFLGLNNTPQKLAETTRIAINNGIISQKLYWCWHYQKSWQNAYSGRQCDITHYHVNKQQPILRIFK